MVTLANFWQNFVTFGNFCQFLPTIIVSPCLLVIVSSCYIVIQPVYSNNYISFIICLSCKFLHLKPISRISSFILAQHLLDFVRLTGKTPSVLVSDAATTNIFGEMQLLLKDFQLMHVSANQNILKSIATNNYSGEDDKDDGNDRDDHGEDDRNQTMPPTTLPSTTPPPLPSSHPLI